MKKLLKLVKHEVQDSILGLIRLLLPCQGLLGLSLILHWSQREKLFVEKNYKTLLVLWLLMKTFPENSQQFPSAMVGLGSRGDQGSGS